MTVWSPVQEKQKSTIYFLLIDVNLISDIAFVYTIWKLLYFKHFISDLVIITNSLPERSFVFRGTRALMGSGYDAAHENLVCSQHSCSSQRCSVELRSGLCTGHSSSFFQFQAKPCIYGPHFLGLLVPAKRNYNAPAYKHIQ